MIVKNVVAVSCRQAFVATGLYFFAGSVAAEQITIVNSERDLEEVLVYGLSPLSDELTQANKSATRVQLFTERELRGTTNLAEGLERFGVGVAINDAQNNPLQPDIRFRGYTASPLLGAAQGIAVYYNGVRVNEVFGDTVNWDVLPSSTVQKMAVVAGANPVFGQNALGGAIVIRGKDGFASAGGTATVGVGNYGERVTQFSLGDNDGTFAYFVGLDRYEEDGWRDFSPTEADNLYSSLSYRDENRSLTAYFNYGDSRLLGNGAVPERLLKEDRDAVFTHPDRTENRLLMGSLSFEQQFSETSRLVANVFFRELRADSFNGDGSEYDECEFDDSILCDEDEPDEAVKDTSGNTVSTDFNAVNNISRRDQTSSGATLQWYTSNLFAGYRHDLTVGADYLRGRTRFVSDVEFAQLTETRSTTRSGRFDAEGDTRLDADVDMAALYIADIVTLSPQLALNASLRYNQIDVESRDRSGKDPDLNARHRYRSHNVSTGAVYQIGNTLQVYGSVSRASRAPTPIELACSHEDAPCVLPNTFLADPPLNDVVATSVEFGLEGEGDTLSRWQVGLYRSVNRDDIHFQTTGGVSSNEGFFTNIGDTQHQGLEMSAAIERDAWAVNVAYAYLEATFEDAFTAFSPNNPAAENGALAVRSGSRLPGLPKHSIKLRADRQFLRTLTASAELVAASSVVLRGDEANLDREIPGFAAVNASLSYQPAPAITLRVGVKNVFDKDYARFGLYGEADEIFDDYDDDETRFISPAAPRRVSASVRYQW